MVLKPCECAEWEGQQVAEDFGDKFLWKVLYFLHSDVVLIVSWTVPPLIERWGSCGPLQSRMLNCTVNALSMTIMLFSPR